MRKIKDKVNVEVKRVNYASTEGGKRGEDVK